MPDVIVIGAGVSGLLAAARLQAAGRAVLVLEARDRIGGRTHSIDAAGGRIDLGASWVWDTEVHVHRLLSELGIQTFDHHREGIDIFEQPDQVQRGRLPRSAVPERRIQGGAQAIADALAAQVTHLRCRAPVHAIEVAPGGDLRVCTAAGETLQARHVVAALPPAVLASRIRLPAGLDAQQQAVMQRCAVWMAEVAKVVAVYPERFWRSAGLSGRAASLIGPMSEIHDLSGPDGAPAALFGFVHRSQAAAGWQDQLCVQLGRLFGPRAAVPTALHVAAWWEDPETAPLAPAGGLPSLLGHPLLRVPALGGRLHLCATETAAESPGHIDGAVERAEAVARHILEESP